MKQPPTFSTDDPSYFVAASTPGSVRPTVLTVSNGSAGFCFVGLPLIEAMAFVLRLRRTIRRNIGDIPCCSLPCASRCVRLSRRAATLDRTPALDVDAELVGDRAP